MRLRPAEIDLRSVRITPEDGYVLSRLDGPIDADQIAAVTGLPEAKVEEIVARLIQAGALVVEAGSPSLLPSVPPSSSSAPPLMGTADVMIPSAAALPEFGELEFDPREEAGDTPESSLPRRSRVGTSSSAAQTARSTFSPTERTLARDTSHPSDIPSASLVPEGVLPSLEGDRSLPPSVPDIFGFSGGPLSDRAAPSASGHPSVAPTGRPLTQAAERTWTEVGAGASEAEARRLYAERFSGLTTSEKLQIAQAASDPELSALCFDPEPQVIAAILTNARCGLAHARAVALHHRSGVGLEHLARHGEAFRDPQLQRNLLRNPLSPDPILQRIFKGKRLQELYRTGLDKDVPEGVRTKVRGELRKRFATASSDEKADLVMRTEGRVLHLITGCTFDGKTTQILCGRTFNSAVIIQNLAKFTATPPMLLAKIVQQPFVSRQPGLKNLLLRHPNMPGEIKRKL